MKSRQTCMPLCIVLLMTMASSLRGMNNNNNNNNSTDSNHSSSSSLVISPVTPHTADGRGGGILRMPVNLSYTSRTGTPVQELEPLDHSFLDPITDDGLNAHATAIANCKLDEPEKAFFSRKKIIIDTVAIGGALSLFFWARTNIAPTKFMTGLEVPTLVTLSKALLDGGKFLMVPLTGLFIYHELQQKVLLEREVKEQKKEIATLGTRIATLTKSLQQSDETLQKVTHKHDEEIKKVVGKQYNDLLGLQTILTNAVKPPEKKNDAVQLKAIIDILNKQALPLIQSSSNNLLRVQQDIEKELRIDQGVAKQRHWYDVRTWRNPFTRYCHHSS